MMAPEYYGIPICDKFQREGFKKMPEKINPDISEIERLRSMAGGLVNFDLSEQKKNIDAKLSCFDQKGNSKGNPKLSSEHCRFIGTLSLFQLLSSQKSIISLKKISSLLTKNRVNTLKDAEQRFVVTEAKQTSIFKLVQNHAANSSNHCVKHDSDKRVMLKHFNNFKMMPVFTKDKSDDCRQLKLQLMQFESNWQRRVAKSISHNISELKESDILSRSLWSSLGSTRSGFSRALNRQAKKLRARGCNLASESEIVNNPKCKIKYCKNKMWCHSVMTILKKSSDRLAKTMQRTSKMSGVEKNNFLAMAGSTNTLLKLIAETESPEKLFRACVISYNLRSRADTVRSRRTIAASLGMVGVGILLFPPSILGLVAISTISAAPLVYGEVKEFEENISDDFNTGNLSASTVVEAKKRRNKNLRNIALFEVAFLGLFEFNRIRKLFFK